MNLYGKQRAPAKSCPQTAAKAARKRFYSLRSAAVEAVCGPDFAPPSVFKCIHI